MTGTVISENTLLRRRRMSELEYRKDGHDGKAYIISLYDKGQWLMTYKGYINPYCHGEMKLYPYKVGTGTSAVPVPGKHGISILKIKNLWGGSVK